MSNVKLPSRNSEGTSVTEHPSKYRISFKGDSGEWEIYNKSSKEKHRVAHDKLIFMPLIRTSGAAGYYEPANMGYWSNEIQDSRTEIIEVKGNDGNVFAKGLWSNIKETCNARKIDFIANLYVAVKLEGVYELAVIELKTTALVAFGDFAKQLAKGGKSNAVYNTAVKVASIENKKKGAVKYVVPTFVAQAVSEQGMAESGKLADVAIAYLEEYFGKEQPAEGAVEAPAATAAPQSAQPQNAPLPSAQDAPPLPPIGESFEEIFGEDDSIPF